MKKSQVSALRGLRFLHTGAEIPSVVTLWSRKVRVSDTPGVDGWGRLLIALSLS